MAWQYRIIHVVYSKLDLRGERYRAVDPRNRRKVESDESSLIELKDFEIHGRRHDLIIGCDAHVLFICQLALECSGSDEVTYVCLNSERLR